MHHAGEKRDSFSQHAIYGWEKEEAVSTTMPYMSRKKEEVLKMTPSMGRVKKEGSVRAPYMVGKSSPCVPKKMEFQSDRRAKQLIT